MIRKMLVPLLCLFVFAAFFPIIESEHCFYPARKAEILPSLPRAGVFNKIPRTAESGKRGRALAKPGQRKEQGTVCPHCASPGTEQVDTWSPAVPRCTRTAASRGGKRKRRDNY